MKYGLLASAGVVAGVMLVSSFGFGSAAAQGQSTPGGTTKWTVGRTAWGDPDFQGKWAIADTGTPMERPKEFANREFLTDQELATKIANARKRAAPEGDEDRAVRTQKAAPEHEKGIRYQEYNAFWVDGGQRQITPWKRTSLVIDPPDGRIPPLTLEAIKRLEVREAARRGRGEADGWEDRNLSERCLLTAFVRFTTSGTGIKQFIQTPGYVAIMVSSLNSYDPLIIPLDKRPLPGENVRNWLGIPRGRWEGTTLVVETTHINNQQDGGPTMPSRSPFAMPGGNHLGSGDTVKLIERFTRVSPDMIEYSYTIDDPKTYVKPYTVLLPMVKQPDDLLMPENACHEGNYGIVGQLSAGRADEAYALKAAESEADQRVPQLQEMKRRTEEWMKSNKR